MCVGIGLAIFKEHKWGEKHKRIVRDVMQQNGTIMVLFLCDDGLDNSHAELLCQIIQSFIHDNNGAGNCNVTNLSVVDAVYHVRPTRIYLDHRVEDLQFKKIHPEVCLYE